jgi:STE24 endopeptidase
MEWMAAHALQILIVLEILTTSFDMYVKKRQLNKFNETEIPAFYN